MEGESKHVKGRKQKNKRTNKRETRKGKFWTDTRREKGMAPEGKERGKWGTLHNKTEQIMIYKRKTLNRRQA